MSKHSVVPRINWLDPVKGFALLAIMLNHLVEEFGQGPWFTNPGNDWPSLAERLGHIFPQQYDLPVSLVQFLGWLGDSGPGVFIFASGFGLAWAALNKPAQSIGLKDFYTKRLIRIFPLYIAIHFLILAGSLAIPGNWYTLASPHTLLSLLGLRFTDSLFFFINPSWWFIWLILQLYLVFPLLFLALQRFGVARFLMLALAITFASRLLGLEGIRYSQSLYYWMTGIFFGTRLAEFAVGMALASWLLHADRRTLEKLSGLGQIFALSAATYAAGLICSFFWYTTIVSNLLVSLGMSGLFYCLWQGIFRKSRFMAAITTWIGVNAYAVYLLHQTPLIWTRIIYDDVLHLGAALFVLAASFPAGWLISRSVDTLLEHREKLAEVYPARLITWIGSVGVILAVAIIEPMLWDGLKQRAFALLLGGSAALILFADLARAQIASFLDFGLRWASIGAGFLALFVLPERYGLAAVCIGIVFAVCAAIAKRMVTSRIHALVLGGVAVGALAIVLEFSLAGLAPLEAGKWGEFPALQRHPTRVYGLKPDQTTRLRYNNYDYTLKTNSMGLASPEVSKGKPPEDTIRILVVGDAFSMPEGLEYGKAYPALLEKKLNAQLKGQRVEVVNAGVTGYGPAEQYPQMKELVPKLQPDIVVYQFFVNEFLEAHIERKERLKSIGLLSKYNSFRKRILETTQIKAHFEHLQRRLLEIITGEPSRYRYWKSLLRFYETGENDLYEGAKLEVVQDYLRRMEATCKRYGAEMIIYYVPGAVKVSKPEQIAYYPWNQDIFEKSEFDPERPLMNLRKLASKVRVPVVDLTKTLKSYPDQPVYFPKSWHWNAQGHEVAAAAIANDLLQRGIDQK